jgi:hypothetical protein
MRAQRIVTCLLWMAVATISISIVKGEIERTDDLEDQVLQETINAGRGHRDDQGKRDQWNSKEHLGAATKFDSRRPISPDVNRLLKMYRLECSGCDHSEAVSLVNDYVRTTKLEARQQQQKEEWISRGLVLAGLVMCAAIVRFVVLQEQSKAGPLDNVSLDDKKRSEIQQLRLRQNIANAAVQRNGNGNAAPPPTWRDNEQMEVWTTKQEKQYQKALREFGGVGKKERYVLIAAKVDGKSRIECLTHHRLQIFNDEQQQQKDQ